MKWFKHMTDASDDEFINALEAEFDHLGYSFWWKLCEAVGKQMDHTNKCYAEYPIDKWLSIFRIKREKKMMEILEFCAKFSGNSSENSEIFGKLIYEKNGNILRIRVPKLLKLKDEYSKKSGQTPDPYPESLQTPIYRIQNTDTESIINTNTELVTPRENEFDGDEDPPPEGFVDLNFVNDVNCVVDVGNSHIQTHVIRRSPSKSVAKEEQDSYRIDVMMAAVYSTAMRLPMGVNPDDYYPAWVDFWHEKGCPRFDNPAGAFIGFVKKRLMPGKRF